MANRVSQAVSDVLNADKYVGAYLSLEAAQAADRNELITVQPFDSGDFPGMEQLDATEWKDGDIVQVTCFLRIHKRVEKTKARPARQFVPMGAEAPETQDDIPF